MHRFARALGGATLALALSASAASAAPYEPDYGPDITFERSDVWFSADATGIGNLDAAQGDLVGWDGEEPTESGTGAGGVYVGNNYSTFFDEHDARHTFTVKDTFTGYLDTMAVDLYGYQPGASTIGCGMGLAFDLVIDGETILYQAQSEPSADLMTDMAGEDIWATRFAFTRLHEAMEDFGIVTGPDVEHTIYLNAANFYACNEAIWLYDRADAPSGAVFNIFGKQLRAYTEIDVYNPPPPLES